jgi:hypothetical protein
MTTFHLSRETKMWLIFCLAVVIVTPSKAWAPATSGVTSRYKSASVVSYYRELYFPNNAVRVGSTVLYMSAEEPTTPTTFREAEILGLRLMQEGNYDQALKGESNNAFLASEEINLLSAGLLKLPEFHMGSIIPFFPHHPHHSVFEAALKLPGSRPDIIRTKVYQTSPVGGGMGGTESQSVLTLDEFELQAVHYNMACAYAQLKILPQALANLQLALENGFDNFATVRADSDLRPLQDLPEFETLLKKFEPKGFFFGGGSTSKAKPNNAKSSGGFNPFGFFGNK